MRGDKLHLEPLTPARLVGLGTSAQPAPRPRRGLPWQVAMFVTAAVAGVLLAGHAPSSHGPCRDGARPMYDGGAYVGSVAC